VAKGTRKYIGGEVAAVLVTEEVDSEDGSMLGSGDKPAASSAESVVERAALIPVVAYRWLGGGKREPEEEDGGQ
jgi:hypothetical protein